MEVAELQQSPLGKGNILLYKGFQYWNATGESAYASRWYCTLSTELKCIARVTTNEVRKVLYIQHVYYAHNHDAAEYEKHRGKIEGSTATGVHSPRLPMRGTAAQSQAEKAVFGRTKRGAKALLYKGFQYYKYVETSQTTANWRCAYALTKTRCRARAVTRDVQGVVYVSPIYDGHNHDPGDKKRRD